MSVGHQDGSPPPSSSPCSSRALISNYYPIGHDLKHPDDRYRLEHDRNSFESQGVLSPLLPGSPHATALRSNSIEMQDSGISSLENEREAQRINRKMDLYLLPLLSLLYLFNGLDRGNIGNAQTQGFTHDIGALPDDLNLAVSLLFVTFVLFQVPSAAVGQWLGPSTWLPIMMVPSPLQVPLLYVYRQGLTTRSALLGPHNHDSGIYLGKRYGVKRNTRTMALTLALITYSSGFDNDSSPHRCL